MMIEIKPEEKRCDYVDPVLLRQCILKEGHEGGHEFYNPPLPTRPLDKDLPLD